MTYDYFASTLLHIYPRPEQRIRQTLYLADSIDTVSQTESRERDITFHRFHPMTARRTFVHSVTKLTAGEVTMQTIIKAKNANNPSVVDERCGNRFSSLLN
jgi:hypothetical protein